METPPPQFTSYPRSQYRPSGVRFEALSEAFALFGKNWKPMVIGAIPGSLLVGIFTIASLVVYFQAVFGSNDILGGLARQYAFLFVVQIVEFVAIGGMVHAGLKVVRGEAIEYTDCFKMNGKAFTVLVACILMAICTVGGMMACFLPGLLLNGLFMATIPAIIDQRIGPIAGMVTSWEATKPTMWVALVLSLVNHILLSTGASLAGLGLVVLLPIFAMTICIVYRDTVLVPQETSHITFG